MKKEKTVIVNHKKLMKKVEKVLRANMPFLPEYLVYDLVEKIDTVYEDVVDDTSVEGYEDFIHIDEIYNTFEDVFDFSYFKPDYLKKICSQIANCISKECIKIKT